MDITERIAKVVSRWANDYDYQIAEAIVSELGLTEKRQYASFDSSLLGAQYVSRQFSASELKHG